MFKFYDEYGKELRFPNASGKYGNLQIRNWSSCYDRKNWVFGYFRTAKALIKQLLPLHHMITQSSLSVWLYRHLGEMQESWLDCSYAQADAGIRPNAPKTLVRQHSFLEIDHELFSTVSLSFSLSLSLSLPLIQEGQLPLSGEWMCKSNG